MYPDCILLYEGVHLMMDIKVNYIEKGAGKPLIMLHGNGGSLKHFKSQIDFFSRHYRVIALDTRGHGKTPLGERPFTIEQFAEDLKNFMDENNLDKASIIGFSDGGNIALTFALKYQERIEKMAVCGANIYPEGLRKTEFKIRFISYKIHRRICPKGRRTRLLDLIINQPHIKPEELCNIKVPVMVIAGTNDMIKEEHTRLIYKSLPYGKLKFINGSHALPIMRAKKFNTAVYDFLK